MRKGFLNGPAKATTQKKADNEVEKKKEVEEVTKKIVADEAVATATPPSGAAAVGVVKKKPEKRGKRRRTRSHHSSPSPGRGFFVPGYNNTDGAANAMSMAELMDASKGLTNMALAHEIAVDKDFTLQKLKPADNTVEQQLKDMMHKAFWDILDEQLKMNPPEYHQALLLLTEVKTMLVSVLLPQHNKIRDNIEEVLDMDLIKQQIDNEVLEFDKYAGYILGLMEKLCAPVRDEQIAVLKQTTDVVPLFKGIMETLEMMKLDMANFTIQQVRPLIVSQSVEYEKIKFQEFLESRKEQDLIVTREWLSRHSPSQEEISDPKYKKLLGVRVLNDAFSEILEWDDYYLLPETLVMDQKRILMLRDQVERTSVSTAVILLTFSNVSSYIVPADGQKLKENIKKDIDILLEDFHEDGDLLDILPGVAVQVVKKVDDYLVSKHRNKLGEGVVKNLTTQIEELEDPNQRIRDLIQKRIVDFNKQIISGSVKSGMQVPPGLSICQKDLGDIAGQFVRLVNYNKSVFGDYYNNIIANHCLFKVES